MKFGPYTRTVFRALSADLDRLGIPFTSEQCAETLAEQEAAWKAQPLQGRHGPSFDPAYFFLNIEEPWLQEREEELAELGLIVDPEEPDFSDEYVCMKCGKVVSHGPGVCPKHSEILITWSEFVQKKKDAREPSAIPFSTIAWGAAALVGGAYMLSRFLN
jgi:hypothetical protein